jgi:hypothetical protein
MRDVTTINSILKGRSPNQALELMLANNFRVMERYSKADGLPQISGHERAHRPVATLTYCVRSEHMLSLTI